MSLSNKCPKCKRKDGLRMQVYVTLSAPLSQYANLSKTNLRKKEVFLTAALWETASWVCVGSCGYYRNSPKIVRLEDYPKL